jgi:DNA modification methylase
VTDPPYLVGFKDRSGQAIAGDVTDEWLQPATLEMYRVLKKDALMVSFYGWNRVDRFMAAWKAAGFYAVGQIVFTKTIPPTAVTLRSGADSWTTAMKGLMSSLKGARCHRKTAAGRAAVSLYRQSAASHPETGGGSATAD